MNDCVLKYRKTVFQRPIKFYGFYLKLNNKLQNIALNQSRWKFIKNHELIIF